ncbi:diphosphate--fructose-6-phosphate 1-phosphotransferase [Candidatus Clavichlamydia salmonicola]|uniref:diphosphate--fructose-6-phosphate 1-phosphotransferase n=1 Tax=Candidatus Clavichlamydia salmonicola TaxID=469812 RepID=UPI001891AC77|nr:diphosphate--fructose-6-phosphate 1-phosphotransferase [Candidatus Clavichlamydia salmonicola]
MPAFPQLSPLESFLTTYKPIYPTIFEKFSRLDIKYIDKVEHRSQHNELLKNVFPYTISQKVAQFYQSNHEKTSTKPLRIGVLFSGGPAPGGHNVLAGLFDGMKQYSSESRLFGFLEGGIGLINQSFLEIQKEMLNYYRNLGGFDFLGSARKQLGTPETCALILKNAMKIKLDGLVIVGGEGSNTGTAILAEYFAANHSPITVVGIPKTIDGDLRHELLEASFGFDSASSFYATAIGNIAHDIVSTKKNYHFVKLMGRAASHIILECALKTSPNIALIGEEAFQKNLSLQDLIKSITQMILKRDKQGKHYGLILIPEGIIEFIPEVDCLVKEIMNLSMIGKIGFKEYLSENSRKLLDLFPKKIEHQLLYDRDSYGQVWLSKIAVEKLFIHLVQQELQQHSMKEIFEPVSHFLGYEGRCCTPTPFDNTYCYALGLTGVGLIIHQLNGYLGSLTHLHESPEKWQPTGIPLTAMIDMVNDKDGEPKPFISKYLTDTQGAPFKLFKDKERLCKEQDLYNFPGPLQLFKQDGSYEKPTLSESLKAEKSAKRNSAL